MGMLKLNHGWPMLTTDMLDTHTLMPELTDTHMELTVLDTTDMLLEELTSSARDQLMLKLARSLVWCLWVWIFWIPIQLRIRRIPIRLCRIRIRIRKVDWSNIKKFLECLIHSCNRYSV